MLDRFFLFLDGGGNTNVHNKKGYKFTIIINRTMASQLIRHIKDVKNI